uniref:Helicase ATP-binding domain-containing protein n=1 Tax=viral metagenome TaxID=1070528 RepID=A0A6C0H6M7_9ZZZZ
MSNVSDVSGIQYPDYSDTDFSRILNKYEFTSNDSTSKKSFVYQDPSQLLLRNYISKSTVYDNVLLYHLVGTGKTCASISIAEGFKEYITNMGRRIVVLVKNKNIQRNFMNELLGPCTKNEYFVSEEERDLYFGKESSQQNTGVQEFQTSIQRRELINQVHQLINKSYQFITYGTFVNRVLGAKDYERDELGRNTTKVKRVDGKLQRKRPKDEIKNFSNCVVIVDEAHNVTNNDIYLALHQVLSRSYNTRLVLLTATPMYDNPKEIFELANLLNANKGGIQLPIRNELFKPYASASVTQTDNTSGPLIEKVNSDYINGTVLKGGIVHITELGKSVLTQALFGRVSYLQSNTDTNPRVNVMGKELIPGRVGTTKVVYCRMSKEQYLTYIQALKTDIKSDSKYDFSSVIQNTEAAENVTETTGVSKTGSLFKKSSDAATMSYPGKLYGKDGFLEVFEKSNNGGYRVKSMYSEVLTKELKQHSAKLYNLLQNIQNSPGNVFVYTNFVSFGGTTLLRLLLSANGYREFRSRNTEYNTSTFVVFDETTNIELREKYRRIFNSPENKDGKYIKVLIGSPIISEGITLKNVRQVHILEPSWNMSRINQIIGRAVRNMSHFDLPPTERTVDVFKYVSVYIPRDEKTVKQFKENRLFGFSIDREKYILSEEKDRANKQVERLLKTIAFDCQLMKGRNVQDHAFHGSPECDYIDCDFNCQVNMENSSETDKSTYNIGIANFEKFDIEFVLATLRDLFQKYFIWTLNDIVEYIHGIDPKVSNEVIFYTLGQITVNKSPFTDMYGRDGFIINKGEFYIFNSSDIDVNSSLYSKYLDFTVDKNKYTLEQFVKAKTDISISSDTNTNVTANTKTKTSKPKPVAIVLSASDLRYNDRIIQNNDIFGTFRQRGTLENPYGPADEKFRIVDQRETCKGKGKGKFKRSDDTSSDKRKKLSGMWIGSFEKGQLIEIAKHLGIQAKLSFKEYDKVQLGKMIQKYLIDKNLVVK